MQSIRNWRKNLNEITRIKLNEHIFSQSMLIYTTKYGRKNISLYTLDKNIPLLSDTFSIWQWGVSLFFSLVDALKRQCNETRRFAPRCSERKRRDRVPARALRRERAPRNGFRADRKRGVRVNRYRLLVADNCRRQRSKPPVTYDKLQVMPRASVHPCVAHPSWRFDVLESSHVRRSRLFFFSFFLLSFFLINETTHGWGRRDEKFYPHAG